MATAVFILTDTCSKITDDRLKFLRLKKYKAQAHKQTRLMMKYGRIHLSIRKEVKRCLNIQEWCALFNRGF